LYSGRPFRHLRRRRLRAGRASGSPHRYCNPDVAAGMAEDRRWVVQAGWVDGVKVWNMKRTQRRLLARPDLVR